jgi:hypothetical protein
MSTANIVFGGLIALVIIGGAFFALRLGKVGPSVPKTGGQMPVDTTPENPERHGSLDKQKRPAAE